VAGGAVVVLDGDRALPFAFEDLLRYHGGHSPGGVAHAFKVLERALPLLAGGDPVQRRELTIATAFGGPGARDGFELVTRAVTDGRLTIDDALARPDLGAARERFVFRLGYRGAAVTVTLRDGFVSDEFVALAGAAERSAAREERLTVMKWEMAERVMGAPADAVYDALS
jgi:hypothetical protein